MFLRDEDIKRLVTDRSITNIADMTSDPDGPKSPIQPCSLDLTVGKIFVPCTPPNLSGGCETPKMVHPLGPGETAIVETNEIFHLPDDIGAFGFPPTSVSDVGVLVTNLGHIDPGFDGRIKFTLVNMGHKSYSLKRGDRIYTTLFFRLGSASTKSFRARHPDINSQAGNISVSQELLDSLSRDFLDVPQRAQAAAASAVTEELRKPYRNALITGIGVLLFLGLNAYNGWSRVDSVKQDLVSFQGKVSEDFAALRDNYQMKAEIQELRVEIQRIKKRLDENHSKNIDGRPK